MAIPVRQFEADARRVAVLNLAVYHQRLEQFEEAQKQPGQLTVGIGWYQWGDHYTVDIGEKK